MANFVTLTKIVSERHVSTDSDEDIGDQPTVITTPVDINTDNIRCFYARKEGREGTRLTFSDGGGFVVTESYTEVKAKVRGIGFAS